MHFKNH